MAGNPNKLSNFWQELKRRKVIRVISVYAAAAFVIIELINNVYEPLRLPEWTPTLVIVLLCVGFIITVIISWVYDVTPEGLEKTEPAHKVKEEGKPVSSKSWKIASYISFVVIIGLIVLNIIPRSDRSDIKEILDKSIAVLPFINDSPDEENAYFINGIMEEILLNLQTIKDLRVISRNSVEQYRGKNKPTTPEIAKELGVNYIVEGSGQKYGNTFVLRVQLIEGSNDNHLWGDSYEQEIESVDVIINIQNRIAESIAAELEAIITPEEKQLIKKITTSSLTAYDFYQRGRDEYLKYTLDNDNREALEIAEDLYHKALEYDSTFAPAYVGLADLFWDRHFWDTYFSKDFLDSVLILIDIAISHDDQLAEAYTLRGVYNQVKGNNAKAIEEFDKAIKLNPNDWRAYNGKGRLYVNIDYVKCIDNYQKAAFLNRGSELPSLLSRIGYAYYLAGFSEKAIYYYQEALKLDGDSTNYYSHLGDIEFYQGNFEIAIDFLKKGYVIDSNHIYTLWLLGNNYMYLGQYEEALEYMKYVKIEDLAEYLGTYPIHFMNQIGYVYWQNGYKEEAKFYFNEQINYCNTMNELRRRPARELFWTYYHLAGVYAFRGEKDKAYENLRIFNQRQRMSFPMLTVFNNYPLFDSIRDEPEFQQIVRDVEAKYQAEHERVRQWLEENDML